MSNWSEIGRQRKMEKESASKKRGHKGSERSFTMEEDFSIFTEVITGENEDEITDANCIFCGLYIGDNPNMVKEFRDRKCCKFCLSDATLVVNGGHMSNIKTTKKKVDGKFVRYFILSDDTLMPI